MNRNRERRQEFTITFLGRGGINVDDARSMFENFGRINRVVEKNGRFFVSFLDKGHADAAILRYGKELGCDFARERSDKDKERQTQDRDRDRGRDGDRQKQDQDKDRERSRFPQDRDRDRGGEQDSRSARNFDDDRSSDKGSNSANWTPKSAQTEPPFGNQGQGQKRTQSHPPPPLLIDPGIQMPETFVFIIGNLPPSFTEEDVKALTLETKPSHIGIIDTTPNAKLNFCPIHLDAQHKVDYLYKKLDGFIIGGHQLIAMEADQLYLESQAPLVIN